LVVASLSPVFFRLHSSFEEVFMPGTHSMRWLVFFVCGSLAALGCSTDTQQSDATGSLSLDLVLADGIVINTVSWEISRDDMEPMSGMINTSAPGSTASVEVFGLPPGEGYLVELEATSEDGEVTCRGSAEFGVEIGVSTDAMVLLNCKLPRRLGGVRVNGTFNICAELLKMVVSPLQTSVGNDIDLMSIAMDAEGDAITYVWSASGGSIADPNAASTAYTCQEVGEHEVTVSVTDNDVYCNMATWTVPITCVEGEGGDLCEDVDCDDGNECTDNDCKPANGECVNDPNNEGGACGDGGTCMSGVCEVAPDCTVAADCNDGNQCTSGDCIEGICEFTPTDGASCEVEADVPGTCDNAGNCVGLMGNDPAPEFNTPGEFGCDTGENDFTRTLSGQTSEVFSGTVSTAEGDGEFYVVNAAAQETFGTIPTDLGTGTNSVEIPLFCGVQLVKLVWPQTEGACVLVIEVTTTDCVAADIRLTLSWDSIGLDWELHLIKPGGRINDNATDCTWTSCISSSPDWGVQGDSSDDPSKDIDNTGPFGPENIFLAKPESGTYTVMVEHWSSGGDPQSDGQVVINILGQPSIVLTTENLPPFSVWTVATIEWPGGTVTPSQDVFDCTDSWSGGCTSDIP
jgi:hypothetical protein